MSVVLTRAESAQEMRGLRYGIGGRAGGLRRVTPAPLVSVAQVVRVNVRVRPNYPTEVDQ